MAASQNRYTGSVSIGYRIFDFNKPLFRSIKQGLIARIMPLLDGSKMVVLKPKFYIPLKCHQYILLDYRENCKLVRGKIAFFASH